MYLIVSSFFLLLFTLSKVNTKDVCTDQAYFLDVQNSQYFNNVFTKKISNSDCSQLGFDGNERLNSDLGSLRLAASIKNKNQLALNISFHDIKWNKAFLRLTELNKPGTGICKVYTAENQLYKTHYLPILEISDPCFTINESDTLVNYEVDFKAHFNTDILSKRFVFKPPTIDSFDDAVPLSKRQIFLNVDTSSNYGLILKIQTLPLLYNVTYYKIEVFKQKDNSDLLLDVRLIKADNNKEISFEYLTYNEEGHYFFKVSAINDICPEEKCLKSLSPKVYIKRKYPPLVIGIVGASFLIPFVLFIFHMWTRRSQSQDKNEDQQDKIFIVHNQTPEQHYAIVKILEKSLRTITNAKIINKIQEATHILYICGTHIFEPDPVVHKHLVIEANKAMSHVEILIVSFPYSTKEIPPYLKKCLRFELMADFGKLVHIFSCDAEFEADEHYVQLSAKVKAAENQTEPRKILLNMPVIIVTEQSDSSDAEAKEGDVLL